MMFGGWSSLSPTIAETCQCLTFNNSKLFWFTLYYIDMMQRSAFFVVPIHCHIGCKKSVFNHIQFLSVSRIVPCVLVFALLLCILLSSHACGLFRRILCTNMRNIL